MNSAVAVAEIGPTRPSVAGLPALVVLCGSGGLLLGALGFQYLGGYPPCSLCYWQRYGHLVALALAWSSLLPVGRAVQLALVSLAGVALIATAGLAVHHVGVEWKWWTGPPGCAAGSGLGMSIEDLKRMLRGTRMVRCDEIPWSLLGLSMAGWNAVLSAALGGWALTMAWRRAPRPA